MAFLDGKPVAGRGAGIATFAGIDWVTDPTGAQIAVLGVPFDAGGAVRVGARQGPAAIRRASMASLRPSHRNGRVPTRACRCIDMGDVALINELPDVSRRLVEDEAFRCLDAGARVLALGGDHATTLPLLRAARRATGVPLALVHFDAHQDVVESYYGGAVRYNNGTVFSRAVEEGLVDPQRSIQMGMNGTVFPGMRPEDSRALGFTVIEADALVAMRPDSLAQRVFAITAGAPVYLSFDLDVFDVSVAPGTGAPEAGGLLAREGLAFLRALDGLPLVGADVVEMNPLFDSADITAILAANVAFELLTLLSAATGEGHEQHSTS